MIYAEMTRSTLPCTCTDIQRSGSSCSRLISEFFILSLNVFFMVLPLFTTGLRWVFYDELRGCPFQELIEFTHLSWLLLLKL